MVGKFCCNTFSSSTIFSDTHFGENSKVCDSDDFNVLIGHKVRSKSY